MTPRSRRAAATKDVRDTAAYTLAEGARYLKLPVATPSAKAALAVSAIGRP